MTDEHHTGDFEINEADSKVDAIAALCLILIAVSTVIYFVSHQ